jgi:hypothetical protein
MGDQNEKPTILVIVTLFLAMTLVYIVFFRVETSEMSSDGTDKDISIPLTGNNNKDWSWSISWIIDQRVNIWWTNTGTNTTTIDTDTTIIKTWYSTPWLLWKDKIDDMKFLKSRYGSIEIAELLWLSIKEAFTDTGWIQYGYLWSGELDSLSSTVRRLWWNVLAIEKENDIIKNLLRWDRILFINIPQVTFVRLPTEQKIHVAMIVIIGKDKWIIRAPTDRYYTSKKIMKSIFEQLYLKKL